jgi:hypothetical protein
MAPLSLIPKLVLLTLSVLGIGLAFFQAASPAHAAEQGAGPRRLRHVVLFKFKDSSTPDDVARIVAGFRALPAKIKGRHVVSIDLTDPNQPELGLPAPAPSARDGGPSAKPPANRD